MATKTQVRAAVQRLGGSWDEQFDSIDAPPFHVWKANLNHSIAIVYDLNDGERMSDRWEAYLEDVRFGTVPCTFPDCDMCAGQADNQKDATP